MHRSVPGLLKRTLVPTRLFTVSIASIVEDYWFEPQEARLEKQKQKNKKIKKQIPRSPNEVGRLELSRAESDF